MSVRRAIFWIHLAVGLAGAIVILMLAVTGVILTYEAQLNRRALRDYRADPPAPDASRRWGSTSWWGASPASDPRVASHPWP